MMRYLQNAHLYHFTLGTLTDLLASEGFTLVKGDQEIGAFFQKVTKPSGSYPRRPVRLFFLLLYIFAVEILYRTYLLKPFIVVRNFVRRGIRHMLRDSVRWIRG
jgi:hypothetical protein